MDTPHCPNCSPEGRTTHRTPKQRDNLLSRLNRIEGQIRGIKGMLEKDAYCDDILNQIAAARAALDSVSKLLLESHIKTCVTEKLRNGDEDIINELMSTINKLL
ncbi:MAG: metal-sensitive transcriptional regulator [Eubacteriales bacterium]